MENIIRFHTNNFVETSLAYADYEDANYLVGNVKTPLRKQAWRSGAGHGTAARIRFDATAAAFRYANSINIINHNVYIGTFTIIASDTNDLSNPAVTTGYLLNETFDGRVPIFGAGEGGAGEHGAGGYLLQNEVEQYVPDMIRVYYFTAGLIQANYWAIDITESAGTGLSYLEIGKIALGTYLSPSRDITWGVKLIPVDESVLKYSEGGQPIVDAKPKRVDMELTFSPLSKNETYWNIFNFLNGIGKRKDYVVNVFPEGTTTEQFQWTRYGRTAGDPPGISINNPRHNSVTGSVRFRESL